MLTIDLPRIARPNLHLDGANTRTATQWQTQAKADGITGRGKGKKAASRYAKEFGHAVVQWQSGNVTVYAQDRNGNNGIVRIRFSD